LADRQDREPILVTEGIWEDERRLDNPDLNRILCDDFDHIKAESNVGHLEESEPIEGSLTDQSLFFGVHGIERASHLIGTARFHLGKDKRVTVTADEIDFSPPRRTEVPTENLPSLPLQITGGRFLTPSAQSQMSLRNRRWVGRPEQNRGDDAGKVHAS